MKTLKNNFKTVLNLSIDFEFFATIDGNMGARGSVVG
jgi:hypothetical protein